MTEVPICQARANVMIYDDANKKWVPSGSSQGLSKVQIYQHTVNQTFRVVGRKLQDHEVVINCAILKNLKYNQATPTFHQWRDNRHVYGLNFANTADSETFATAMITALETLNNQGRQPVPQPPNPPAMGPPQVMGPPQGISLPQGPPIGYQPQNGPQYTEIQDARMSRPEHKGHVRYPSGGGGPVEPPRQAPPPQAPPPQAPAAPPAPPAPPAVVPQAPPAPPAPPAAPPAPPAAPPAPPAAPAAPPAPPAPGGGGAPPPAPPPPPVATPGGDSSSDGTSAGGGGLAAALQNAKLKKTAKKESTESKPPPGGGGVNHMDELAKKIARRAAISQNNEDSSARNVSPSPTTQRQSMEPRNGKTVTNGTSSPKFQRKNEGSIKKFGRNPSLTGQENIQGASSGGTGASSTDLENLKQEILSEMRKEIHKVKQEILDAIRDSAR